MVVLYYYNTCMSNVSINHTHIADDHDRKWTADGDVVRRGYARLVFRQMCLRQVCPTSKEKGLHVVSPPASMSALPTYVAAHIS